VTEGGAAPARVWLLAAFVVAANAIGNLALSWGMKHPGTFALSGLSWIDALLNPYVAAGVALLALWTVTRIKLLSWADLSFVLPVTSAGYVVNALLGYFVYHEDISPARWLGTLLILAGAALTGLTPPKAAAP
jgi:uncharacterized membrane protein